MPATIAVTLKATVAAPRAALFAWFVPVELPRILRGYGPLPAVVATSGQTAPWDQVGASRTVHLADRTTAREAVTACEAPAYFAYRVSDITHPLLRRLARGATGQWWFTDAPPTADGRPATRVVWRYTFTARSRVASAALRPIAAVLWRGYMRVGLAATKTLAEREAGGPGGSPAGGGAGADTMASLTPQAARLP